MRILDFDSFVDDFALVAKPTMNMSIYKGNYNCACGKSHRFGEHINIICEGLMKVMVTCPDDIKYVTSVKIKTFLVFKFKGFESLAATKIKTEMDAFKLQAIYDYVRL